MGTIKIKKEKKPLVNFTSLLGGTAVFMRPILSDFDLIALSSEGIAKASLDSLISHLGITKKSFSENILDTSIKTLERKKATDHLDKKMSSHIIEIAKVVEHAFRVFEDGEKVKSWLNYPNRALNNMKPIDLFYIPTGLNMVNNVLGRIEHGIYS